MGTQRKTTGKTWKEKAKQKGRANRDLRQEHKRQKQRAQKWRNRYYDLKKAKQPKQVKRHRYPLELMWMAVWMHVSYNVSLRGVSQSICKLGQLYGLAIDYISPSTIRNWCLKFGFYCLLQPLEKGKYVLICDESVEIGKEHLMLLLVVPIERASPISPLSIEDVKVLDLSVQQSWKAHEVSSMIKVKTDEYGLELAYGISDKDSTLRNALKDCELPWIGDCTHEMANKTKAIFKDDELFNGFIKQLNALRAKWIMSKNNFYVPPGLRSKSRFHQLFIVHKWGQDILDNWQDIPLETKKELAFVQESKQLIKTMKDFHYLIESFAGIFKSKGIQNNSLKQWNELVEKYRSENNLSEQVEQFITCMNHYLNRQQKAIIPQNLQILCCSDIIESTFGKYKNKGGAKIITDDVLKIVAYPHSKQLEDVKRAMEGVKIVDIREWKMNNTPVSKLALLKRKKKKSTA